MNKRQRLLFSSLIILLMACQTVEGLVTSPPTMPPTATRTPLPTPTVMRSLSEVINPSPSPTATPFITVTLAPPEPTAPLLINIDTPLPPATLTPTPTPTLLPLNQLAVSCADVETHWGRDWPAVISALAQLMAAGQRCGEEPLSSKKYAAHFEFARMLEQAAQTEAAISQYQAALRLNPRRNEALTELIRLSALPEPTPVPCSMGLSPQPDPAPAEPADPAQFISVTGQQLQWQGRPFVVRGVNYYPRRWPWHLFLEESTPATMALELDFIKQAGFNTVRVFLRYEPLFICPPEYAIPNEAIFAKVDALFRLAGERNLKLLVTLNDLPDLAFRPLYTDWEHYNAQTVYIVRRYRNMPHLLAWDLRNEGDLDYGVSPTHRPMAEREQVLRWLAQLSELVREHDPHHLLTAGWYGDPGPTAPFVDLLSFHHWVAADNLQARITAYQQRYGKPLLLQEVGYHSWAAAPHAPQTEAEQAAQLGAAVAVAERQNIAGWLVWAAFDFVPQPGQPENFEHHFGLWRTNLTPKPALSALPLPN